MGVSDGFEARAFVRVKARHRTSECPCAGQYNAFIARRSSDQNRRKMREVRVVWVAPPVVAVH